MDIDKFKESAQVVIVDDTEDDGLLIQRALNKRGVASSFYHIQSDSDLPNQPIENIRLVFLDLNFAESSQGLGADNAARDASIALHKLSKFISVNSFYILVIWSSNITQPVYDSFCERIGDQDTFSKPFKIFCLDKTEIGGNLDIVAQKINDDFLVIPLFQLFLDWENMVNKAITKTLQSLIPPNTNNNKLSGLLNSLAGAYSGGVHPRELTPKDALLVFDGILQDNISNEIVAKDFGDIYRQIAAGEKLNKDECAKVNYHLFFNPDLVFSPGIVLKTSKIGKKLNKLDNYASHSKEFVKINITPLCDHAHENNQQNHYILGGIFYKEDGTEPGVSAKSDCPVYKVGGKTFLYKGNKSVLIVDLGSQFSEKISSAAPSERAKILKLRDGLVIDIQQKVAGHQSRPGHTLL